jgi:long-subunit acyl-CoA synthetase (AMP-forming)
MNLIDKIAGFAREFSDKTALCDNDRVISYSMLEQEVYQLTKFLDSLNINVMALKMDNIPEWVVCDLALLNSGICNVPLPPFFSQQQAHNAIRDAGVQAIITDNLTQFSNKTNSRFLFEKTISIEVFATKLHIVMLSNVPEKFHKDTVKITYTSGTTGEPKGVMLSWENIFQVVCSLVNTVKINGNDRHLPVTPLAVLLENIAGVYATLWAGGKVILPGLASVGLSGSSKLTIKSLVDALNRYQPSTLIMTPQILQQLVEYLEAANVNVHIPRFMALGGAPTSEALLKRARKLKLPVYEGYGMSECASVITLNTPDANEFGSVGKPLPHIELYIDDSNEIIIRNHNFTGYVGKNNTYDNDWRTGDTGYIDEDGFLFLTGRKRNIFITTMGRNVAPEWLEKELILQPSIIQAAVFGDCRQYPFVVVFSSLDSTEEQVIEQIRSVNAGLPDYAAIHQVIFSGEAFTVENGLLSGTGRNRRTHIYEKFKHQIDNDQFQECIL